MHKRLVESLFLHIKVSKYLEVGIAFS